MTKKGFTMIELIVTMVILAVVMLISIVSYNNLSERSLEQQFENTLSLIKEGALDYGEDHKNEVKSSPNSIMEVTLQTLVHEKYLEGSNGLNIKDPRDDEPIDVTITLSYVKKIANDNSVHYVIEAEVVDNKS